MSGYSDQVISGQNTARAEFTSGGDSYTQGTSGSSELRGADLQPASAGGADYTSDSAHGLPKVHEGHVSAGSQLPTGQGFTGVDMAAETAKFDNAFGAVPGYQETSGSYRAVGSGTSGTTGTIGSTGAGYGSTSDSYNQSGSTGNYGSTSDSYNQSGSSTTGGKSYTGNKEEQRDQMAQEKKENANQKKEELKDRNASGESKRDIAKDEYNKVSQQADNETQDGKKPGLMDKIKTAVKKL